MKGLNISKLKKISSDKNTTTFRHPDGHEIRVAHKALSPKLKKDLENIPHYAEGTGDVQSFDQNASIQDSNIPDYSNPMAEKQNLQDYYAKMGVGGLGGSPESRAETSIADLKELRGKEAGQLSASQAQKLADLDKVALASQPQSSGATGNWGPADGAIDRSVAQEEQANAPQPQAEMEPAQSAPSAPVAEANSEPQQAAPPIAKTFAEHKKAALDEHLAENQAFEQDLKNGHITPKTYSDLFAQKSTLGKIGTAFGLLLSGMGAGLTHQPNALLAMMDKQISNDLESQKSSKTNAIDFLKLNQQRLLNQSQSKYLDVQTKEKAYALSRAQMNSAALHQMVQMAQKLPEGSPQRQQADQALAFMNNAVQAENYSIADRYATGSAFAKMLYGNQPGASDEQNFQKQTSGMRMLGPQGETRAKDMESKHVPGFKGQASVPVSTADRDALMGHQKLQSGLDDLLNFTKTHSTIIPGTKEYNIGQSKVRKLQSEIREGVLGTVYKAGEQPLLDKFVAQNPAGLDKWWKTIPQLQTLKDANIRDLNVRKESLGFPVDKQAATSQDQPQIKIVNGVKYMRGPNGEAVKVP